MSPYRKRPFQKTLLPSVMILLLISGCGGADDDPEESQSLPDLTGLSLASDAEETEPVVGMTEAHNQIRSEYGLAPLTWSGTLTEIAAEWADVLAKDKGCQLEHRPSRMGTVTENGVEYQVRGNVVQGIFVGENLYWEWSSGPLKWATPKSVVDAWASEVEFYDYDSNSCDPQEQCGHYTQIIWKDTQQVGCAVSTCDDEGIAQVWVCNYWAAGNLVGERPY